MVGVESEVVDTVSSVLAWGMSDTAEGTLFDIVEATAQRGPALPAEAPSPPCSVGSVSWFSFPGVKLDPSATSASVIPAVLFSVMLGAIRCAFPLSKTVKNARKSIKCCVTVVLEVLIVFISSPEVMLSFAIKSNTITDQRCHTPVCKLRKYPSLLSQQN